MYSREFELASDEQGWEYLIKANIDPSGMIRFFEKLEAEHASDDEDEEESTTSELMEFVSTHPATDVRIEILQEKWEAVNKHHDFMVIKSDFKLFKSNLQAIINTAYEN